MCTTIAHTVYFEEKYLCIYLLTDLSKNMSMLTKKGPIKNNNNVGMYVIRLH